MITLEALREKRDQLTASLVHINDLRPGFLTTRFRRCGKPNCHCAQRQSPGHGPSYSLTHRIGGKTVTQVIPQGASVERTKAQLAEYRRFRQLVRELITVSEQICSVQLREAQTAPLAKIKKNLFGDLLAMDVVQEIETLLGRQAVENLDFEALEVAVRQQVLQLAGRAIEQRLNADASDARGACLSCRCGGKAHFVGRRRKQFHSVLGSLWLKRAYYHCQACGHGYFPRDRHLGMENTSLSPALTRMTGTVGALVSFQEGSELLKELAGVTVEAKQVERTAEALGQEIAEDERNHSERSDALPLPQTLYLGIDGTGIPLRAEELTGVLGKTGGAKTREVKLCTVWSAESRDAQGMPIRDEGSVTYSAAIERAATLDIAKERSPFAQRVWREAQRRRFPQAARRVTLGDGACWIWNIVAELFPGAI